MSSENTPLLAVGSARPGRRAKHFIVVATLLTGFLSALDLTSELTEQPALTAVVATCIPTISSELQSAKREAWIGTAYLWSNVTFTPLYGRLSDLIGRRAAYLQALTLFTIGTLCCGLAPSFTALTVARFVAGMGGGGMGTVSSVLMADLFAPEERGFYQGLSFAMFGAGIGLGGPFGGLLTQYLGWRAAFYTQVPLAAVCIILVFTVVPKGKGSAGYTRKSLRQVDFGGSITLLVAIGALLQLLDKASDTRPITRDPWSLAMAIIFPIAFLLFIYVELCVAVKPVLPLSLLRSRTPLCVGIIAGVIAIVNFNMLYHLPAIYEIVFQQPLSVAGAHLLPNSIAMTLSAPLMGLAIKRYRRYKWATVVCCAGPVIAMTLIATMTKSSNWAIQWLSVIPMGAGFSGLLTSTLIAMLNSVDKSEIATATGFISVWRNLGQVFGVGLSSAVYQSSLSVELYARFDSPKLSPEQQEIARDAFGVALRNTFLFGLAGATLVLVTALCIPDHRIRSASEPDDDGEES